MAYWNTRGKGVLSLQKLSYLSLCPDLRHQVVIKVSYISMKAADPERSLNTGRLPTIQASLVQLVDQSEVTIDFLRRQAGLEADYPFSGHDARFWDVASVER